jgi:hypothetical protein
MMKLRRTSEKFMERDTAGFTSDDEKRVWDEGLKDGILLGLREGMLVTLRSIRDMDWRTYDGPNDFMEEIRDEIKSGSLVRRYSDNGKDWLSTVGEVRGKRTGVPGVNSISVAVQGVDHE